MYQDEDVDGIVCLVAVVKVMMRNDIDFVLARLLLRLPYLSTCAAKHGQSCRPVCGVKIRFQLGTWIGLAPTLQGDSRSHYTYLPTIRLFPLFPVDEEERGSLYNNRGLLATRREREKSQLINAKHHEPKSIEKLTSHPGANIC